MSFSWCNNVVVSNTIDDELLTSFNWYNNVVWKFTGAEPIPDGAKLSTDRKYDQPVMQKSEENPVKQESEENPDLLKNLKSSEQTGSGR